MNRPYHYMMEPCAILEDRARPYYEDRMVNPYVPLKKLQLVTSPAAPVKPIPAFVFQVAVELIDFGGSGEIRTHGRLTPSPVFKTGALNRSATLPVICIVVEIAARCASAAQL